MARAEEHFSAYGHPFVTATHRSTFEITAEEHLSPAGSCIIAVRSEKSAAELSPALSALLTIPGSTLTTLLTCDDISVTIHSSGSPALCLDHPTDLVWRRSAFTCGRTIGIYADKTAASLPRELIDLLREERRLDVTLIAEADPCASSEQGLVTAAISHIMGV